MPVTTAAVSTLPTTFPCLNTWNENCASSYVPSSCMAHDGNEHFSDWKPEWNAEIFEADQQQSPTRLYLSDEAPGQNQFLLWRRERMDGRDRYAQFEKRRIDDLKKNIKARHYHVTFEPLFDDIGEIDFEGIDWIVIGTETGNRKGKSYSRPNGCLAFAEQARLMAYRCSWKEDLLPIMGDERMIQELPEQFTRRIQWIWIQ